MENNGTYRYPGNQPKKPVDWKKFRRGFWVGLLVTVLLIGALTCFYIGCITILTPVSASPLS